MDNLLTRPSKFPGENFEPGTELKENLNSKNSKFKTN